MVNKSLIKSRFFQSIQTYDENAFVQKEMSAKLGELIRLFCGSHFNKILEIGCGTGMLTQKIARNLIYNQLFVNDLVGEYFELLKGKLNGSFCQIKFFEGDIETIPWPDQDLDLIVSGATFQWLDDLEKFLKLSAKHLNHEGYICFSSFGQDNFIEIRNITGEGLNYPDYQKLFSKISDDFEILHFSEEIIPVTFKNPVEVIKHIKYTGVNALKQQKWNKTELNDFLMAYEKQCSNEYGVELTYHPVYGVLKKRIKP